jgi:outer membrane receptor protein involved in Fe transport
VDETNILGSFQLGNPYVTDPALITGEYDTANDNAWTQEVRLQSKPGRFQWLVGAFYSSLDERQFQAADAAGWAPELFGFPLYEGKYSWYVSEHSVDTQIAGFSELSYELIPKLRLTAGARYASFSEHYIRNGNGPIYGGHVYYDLYSHNTAVTPKFNLSYQIDDRNMVYATAGEGTREGGANRNAFPVTACLEALKGLGLSAYPATYKPDDLWNYEVGSKNQFLGGAVRTELAMFYDKWQNIQQEVAPSACGASYFTANLGSATSKGVELSLFVRPTSELTFTGQASYTDATFDNTIKSNGSEVFVSGGDTLGTPPLIVAVTGRYQHRFIDTMTNYFQTQIEYRSHNEGRSIVQDPATPSYDPNIPLPSAVTLVGLRLGGLIDNIDASLFVTNLFDAHPEISRFHAYPGDPLYLGRTERPRTVGVTVTLHD